MRLEAEAAARRSKLEASFEAAERKLVFNSQLGREEENMDVRSPDEEVSEESGDGTDPSEVEESGDPDTTYVESEHDSIADSEDKTELVQQEVKSGSNPEHWMAASDIENSLEEPNGADSKAESRLRVVT